MSHQEKMKAKNLKKNGVSIIEIAKTLGRARNTIKKVVAATTAKNPVVMFRKLPRGVKLPSLSAYLRGGGSPRRLKRLQELVQLDTGILCGKELIGSLVQRWRLNHLKRCDESLQLAYRGLDFYYEVFPGGQGGMTCRANVWRELLRNAGYAASGYPIEPDWVKFFELLKERHD